MTINWYTLDRKIRACIVQEIFNSNRSYSKETFNNCVRLNLINVKRNYSFELTPSAYFSYNNANHNGYDKRK